MKTIVFCAGSPNPNLSILNHIQANLLIGVDSGYLTLTQAGFTPDWAIGDFDSIQQPTQYKHILKLPCEKDETDLVVALKHILNNHQPTEIANIIILGALGSGRLDHLLANVWIAHEPYFEKWLHKIKWFEHKNSLQCFQAGTHILQQEPNKQYLSFIALTPIQQLSLNNVKYPLHNHNVNQPTAWISNEFLANQSQMSFTFKKGLICVIQSSD